jgi:hypothetical protein
VIETQRDITRIFLAVLFIGVLIGTSIWILRPFLGAAIWAVTIVTATWPLMIYFQRRLWGRRSLAVALMTVVLLCVLVVPLWLAIGTIVSNADQIAGWVKSLSAFEVPPPPAWLAGLPLFGGDLVAAWEKIAVAGLQDFMKKLAPYGGTAVGWFATEVGGFGALVLQFLLTVVFAAFLYSKVSMTSRISILDVWQGAGSSIRLAGEAVQSLCGDCLAQSILTFSDWPSRVPLYDSYGNDVRRRSQIIRRNSPRSPGNDRGRDLVSALLDPGSDTTTFCAQF